jgi:hypothetical protein
LPFQTLHIVEMKKNRAATQSARAAQNAALARLLILEGVFGGDVFLWKEFLHSEATARQRKEDGEWVEEMIRTLQSS